MRVSSHIIFALLLLSLIITYTSCSFKSQLDMFDRRDQIAASSAEVVVKSNYFQDTSNSSTSTVAIAEYQAAWWTAIIITVAVIGAVWVVTRIDYSQDTMLYATLLNKE
jgi:hypothetical protein